MAVLVEKDYFASEEQAVEEIEKRGWWPRTMEAPPSQGGDAHWHAFSQCLYVLEGMLRISDAAGQAHECPKGSRVTVDARTVHADLGHEGYSAVFGLSVDPDTIEQPASRSPDQL